MEIGKGYDKIGKDKVRLELISMTMKINKLLHTPNPYSESDKIVKQINELSIPLSIIRTRDTVVITLEHITRDELNKITSTLKNSPYVIGFSHGVEKLPHHVGPTGKTGPQGIRGPQGPTGNLCLEEEQLKKIVHAFIKRERGLVRKDNFRRMKELRAKAPKKKRRRLKGKKRIVAGLENRRQIMIKSMEVQALLKKLHFDKTDEMRGIIKKMEISSKKVEQLPVETKEPVKKNGLFTRFFSRSSK